MADIATKKFYENLGDLTAEYGEDMETKRKALIAAIDKANDAKKKKNAENKKAEDEPIRAAILDIVGAENIVSGDLTAKVNAVEGLEDVKVPKVNAVAKDLVDEGVLVVEKVIVEKGVRNAYRKA